MSGDTVRPLPQERCEDEPCIPEEPEACVILYSECKYQGTSLRVCKDQAFTNIDYEIKSLSVPEGGNIYLYNMPCFNGKNAHFTKSIECLDKSIDWNKKVSLL